MPRTLLLCGMAAVLVAGCGGDEPFCGDGETNQRDEVCDDGNSDDTDFCLSTCLPRFIPDLQLDWRFNVDLARGFEGDKCGDLGIDSVEVDIVGPFSESRTLSCGQGGPLLRDKPAGMYTVTMDPRDGAGDSLVVAPVSRTFQFDADSDVIELLLFEPEDWTTAYVGKFYFRTSWAGADFGSSIPAVVEQVLEMRQDGVLVASFTQAGAALDGVTPSSPVSNVDAPQQVDDLSLGPATLRIIGRDSVGADVFDAQFDVFVGAGTSNETYALDVAAVPAS